jgi:uncharacterized protein (DUF302 family)
MARLMLLRVQEEMTMRFDVPYGMTRRFQGASLTTVRESVVEALKNEGFGVLTEIDVQATLAKKLDVKTEPYVILGACNPQLAHRALREEPALGLLLPCNVVVAQDGDSVVVSAASPRAMFSVVGDAPAPAVREVAEEAESRLRRAIDALPG